MSHENVILVGLDGSDAALHALDWATQEARVRQWGLRLVCSYALPSFAAASLDGGYAALDDSAIRAGAEAVLTEALARVAGSGLPVTSHEAVAGSPSGCSAPSPRRCLRTPSAPPWWCRSGPPGARRSRRTPRSLR